MEGDDNCYDTKHDWFKKETLVYSANVLKRSVLYFVANRRS